MKDLVHNINHADIIEIAENYRKVDSAGELARILDHDPMDLFSRIASWVSNPGFKLGQDVIAVNCAKAVMGDALLNFLKDSLEGIVDEMETDDGSPTQKQIHDEMNRDMDNDRGGKS